MPKRSTVTPPAATGRWARCLVSMSLRVTGRDQVEHLWPGLVVNLERELVPGFTVGQAIAGREHCFEPSGAPGEVIEDAADAPRLDASTGLGDPSTWIASDAGPTESAPPKE